MMAVIFDPKDPDETLDYELLWSKRLLGDTIASSVWEVPAGLTKEDDDRSATSTFIRLSGGTLNQQYSLLNRVTTVTGQIMEQTCKLRVKTK